MNLLNIFKSLILAFAAHTLSASAQPQTIDTEFNDGARNRAIPIRIRVPEGSGKIPLVIFSHGLGGSRDGGKVWGEHWAANGYMVIHTQHPGSDLKLLKSGVGAPLQRLKRGATGEQLIVRAEDIRFVLDEVARRQASGDPIYSRIDMKRIAMTGHSFGAMTTMALANQHYPNTSKTLGDPRFKAFIAFSPQMLQAAGNKPSVLYSDMKRPLFVVTGTIDGDMLGNGASPDKRSAVFDALPPGDKYRVIFENGDHMAFNGGATQESETFLQLIDNRSAQTNATTAALIHATANTLTLKFLDAYVKDEASARVWLANDAAQALGSAGVWDRK
jgi:predicted dienelactone hydrolase